MGRNGSRAGKIEPLEKSARAVLHASSRLKLLQSGDFETLVEVAKIEPETPCPETPVTIQDSVLSIEASTEMLTEIFGPIL